MKSDKEEDVLFADYGDEWLRAKGGTVRPSTFVDYKGIVGLHLNPAFDDDPLRSIKTHHLRAFQGGKLVGDPGIKVGAEDEDVPVRALALWTVKNIMKVLRMILRQAREDGLIDSNPMDGLPKLWEPDQEIFPLTSEQSRLLVAQMRADVQMPTLLLAHLGLRIGEALALRLTDYNHATQP